ncbi:MAG: VanZ family protein [Desulfobacteraceae bacterium]|nr:VanZ family protein [Desulfobacteraceae bacterium]
MSRKLSDYILLAAFIAGLICMFIPSGQSADELRTTKALWNLGHPVLFFLAGHLAYAFYPPLTRRPPIRQILMLFLAVLAAAGATELFQSVIPGRFPSYTDILGDLAGIAAYLSFRFRKKARQYALLHAATACLIALVLWPAFRAASDDFISYRQFPILADFETPFESTRFESHTKAFAISSQKAFHGTRSLKINLTTDTYSGISMQYMPRNWTGFSSLHLAAYNPEPQPIRITIRIHDAQHEKQPIQQFRDRFNRSFTLSPKSWTPISIDLTDVKTAPPRTRRLNLARIQNLGLFVTRAPEPWTLYIDDLRLESPEHIPQKKRGLF